MLRAARSLASKCVGVVTLIAIQSSRCLFDGSVERFKVILDFLCHESYLRLRSHVFCKTGISLEMQQRQYYDFTRLLTAEE